MALLKLSSDQKRRIEQEERVKLAEEQYRAKVREELVADPPERPSNPLRRLLIFAILAAVVYFVVHSMSGQ